MSIYTVFTVVAGDDGGGDAAGDADRGQELSSSPHDTPFSMSDNQVEAT